MLVLLFGEISALSMALSNEVFPWALSIAANSYLIDTYILWDKVEGMFLEDGKHGGTTMHQAQLCWLGLLSHFSYQIIPRFCSVITCRSCNFSALLFIPKTPSNPSSPHFKFSKHNLFLFPNSCSHLPGVGRLIMILFFKVTLSNMLGL